MKKILQSEYWYNSSIVFMVCLFWVISTRYFMAARNVGIYELKSIIIESKAFALLKESQTEAIVFALIIGLTNGLLEVYFIKLRRKHIPTYKLNLIRLFVYVISLFVFIYVVLLFYYLVKSHIDISIFNSRIWDNILTPTFWAFFLHGIVTIFIISIIIDVYRFIGPGRFLKVIFGQYNTPKEEKNIFIFIDLHQATTHAERLGHLKYSQLLQDCFVDISKSVHRYKASIYQYVGDEIVLFWDFKKGKKNNNCLQIYFDYMNQLEGRREYYISNYGILPHFKAAIHFGTVTVCEVGEIKSEIAFHGDVLNTTSRMQKKCNELESDLLASQLLLNELIISDKYKIESKGNILFDGKQKQTEIFKVSK